ncbi:MAG: helix-turn-helix domain-containing protein, partial [Archaeoglobaceae archaeon]
MIEDLPENIRRTVAALLRLKEATASDVARLTGRKRATESHYLNILHSLDIVRKKKVGRKIYY